MSYTDIGHPNQIVGRHADPGQGKPVFQFLLVKLASRCNINCTYCYWFRDAEVYKKPAVFTKDAEDAFCQRLEEHIREHDLEEFLIIYHGGEPLLFPKHRFITFQ
ncbi:MAG: 4Fe-4S cluster-binding domain-containing protein, partial [Hyphomicrobiales bacterium]|nr:4Fe-4S cluster-binding domain-containing protein [Hyphomicrobiales bacterium]